MSLFCDDSIWKYYSRVNKPENIMLESFDLSYKPTWHFVHAIGMFDMTDTLWLWAYCCATWKPGTGTLQGQKGEGGAPGKNGRDGRDGIVGKPVSGLQSYRTRSFQWNGCLVSPGFSALTASDVYFVVKKVHYAAIHTDQCSIESKVTY